MHDSSVLEPRVADAETTLEAVAICDFEARVTDLVTRPKSLGDALTPAPSCPAAPWTPAGARALRPLATGPSRRTTAHGLPRAPHG